MTTPLAELFRPACFEEIVGQDHLLGPEGFITRVVKNQKPLSLILWGPPGCGKTSLARLYAKAFSLPFHSLSAIFSGVSDLKRLVCEIEERPLFYKGMVLFVDEIHRFNKAQQDAFLPFLEKGTITLIGATAENPSFYLNKALLSRLRVLTLNPLADDALEKILVRYEEKKANPRLSKEIKQHLIDFSQGDGRFLMNLLENLESLPEGFSMDIENLKNLLQKRSPLFDKQSDQHYQLISALHKSVRGSDPNSALYWLARMLEGGEDPLYLARRIIRMATEDIGLADPQSLRVALDALSTYQTLGSSEGELALAEAVVYLALAPKSNAIYKAFGEAKKKASETTHLPPPSTILNAPTKMMKDLGFGQGYCYDHDTKHAFSGQNYWPEGLSKQSFYNPSPRGFEKEMQKRLEYFESLRNP